jgi:hypothetical protein
VQEKLAKVWKTCETKQLAKMFEEYMESFSVKKWDSRKKDHINTYFIDGKSTNWNRVQCYYHKDSERFGQENLLIVLRKRAGSYLIVERNGKRAFEVDYQGVIEFDEKLLSEIIEEHKPLFDALIGIVCMTDDDLYRKLQFLRTDDETIGCYFEGHCDIEQFSRVAKDFLGKECYMDTTDEYLQIRKGYYKSVPYHDGCSYWHFFEKKIRGAKAIMEMKHL